MITASPHALTQRRRPFAFGIDFEVCLKPVERVSALRAVCASLAALNALCRAFLRRCRFGETAGAFLDFSPLPPALNDAGASIVARTHRAAMQDDEKKPLYERLVELGFTERDMMRELGPMMGTIARAIGLRDTLKLLDARGGHQVYFPKRGNSRWFAVALLGQETADKVIDAVGSDANRILSNPFSARFMTRAKAVKLIREGYSNNQIAFEVGLSLKGVSRLRGKYGTE